MATSSRLPSKNLPSRLSVSGDLFVWPAIRQKVLACCGSVVAVMALGCSGMSSGQGRATGLGHTAGKESFLLLPGKRKPAVWGWLLVVGLDCGQGLAAAGSSFCLGDLPSGGGRACIVPSKKISKNFFGSVPING